MATLLTLQTHIFTETYFHGEITADLELVVTIINDHGILTENGIAAITEADFTLVQKTPAFKNEESLLLWALVTYRNFVNECNSQFEGD